MKKIKLGLLTGVMAIFIYVLTGCNSLQPSDNPSSAPSTVEPTQTAAVNKITDSPESSAEPSAIPADADVKDEKDVKDNEKEYSDSLCTDKEEVLFRFKMENSDKFLSICLSKEQPDYIVYRFGTKDKIELEYPKDKADSWNKFTYSYYLRGGGAENEGMDMNYLTFENGGYEYRIYQEYTAIDDTTQVGIKITDKATKKETDLKGLSNSTEGSLIDLRDNTKIKIENP